MSYEIQRADQEFTLNDQYGQLMLDYVVAHAESPEEMEQATQEISGTVDVLDAIVKLKYS
jgi:uncharacterized protein YgiM (DUF1202 family)